MIHDQGADARRRADALEAMHRLAEAAGAAGGLDELFEVTLDAVEQALGVSRAAMVSLGADGKIHFKAWRGLSQRYRSAVDGRAPWKGHADRPEPLVVDDVLADPEVAELHDAFRAEGIASMALVPLVHAGVIHGRLVLYSPESAAFGQGDVRIAATLASQVAAAIERRSAVDELVESRGRLEAIFASVADGITAQDDSGRLVFANDAAAQLCGFDTAEDLLAASPAEILGRFELLAEDGSPLPFDELPGRIALATGGEAERLLCYRVLATGDRRWSVVRATPLAAADGRPGLAINVFHDVTETKAAEERLRFLGAVSEALAASLDVDETLRAVARLTVPALADYCLVDLLDAEGRLGRVIIEHADPAGARILEEIRERFPPVFNEAHPATIAVRTAEPVLYADVTRDVLADAAMAGEHLDLYLRLEPSSYLVMPFVARGRVLGTISLGTGPSKRHFGPEDVSLVREVAERAAVALENAMLHRAASESLAQLETVLVSAPAGIGFWDTDLRFLRVNEALAEMNGLPAAEHEGRTLREVLPGLADVLEPLYRRVLETGEPLVHQESTQWDSTRAGGDRYWLSSYFPVRAQTGEIMGVGAVILEITERERAQARLRFMARASELLSGSVDLPEMLDGLARLAVEGPVDGAAIFLERDGALVRSGFAHDDPHLEEQLARASDRFTLSERSAHPLVRAFRRGEAELIAEVAPDADEADELSGRQSPGSLIFAPLVARQRTIGIVALWASRRGALGEAELETAVELARRAAVAIDRASLYEASRESEQRLRAAETQLRSTIAAAAVGTWTIDLVEDRVVADPFLTRLFGLSPEARSTGVPLAEVVRAIHPDDRPSVEAAIEEAISAGSDYEADFRVFDAEGELHWIVGRGKVELAPDGAPLRLIGAGAEITRERAVAERFGVLRGASALIGESLDHASTLDALASVVVPAFADFCFFDLLEPNGMLRRAGWAAADDEQRAYLESAPGHVPTHESVDHPIGRVLRTGEPALVRDTGDDWRRRAALSPEHLALMQRVDVRSLVSVPLLRGAEVFGVLTMGLAGAGRRYGSDDVTFAQELAARAATALEAARLYGEAQFQRALLERQGEASIDGLLVVGADSSILSINQRFREIWQIPEEVIARGDDAAHEAARERVEDPDAFIARVREVYARREATREDLRFRDGRTIERYGAPVTAPDGSYLGYLWSFRDITERKRVERELERRAEAAQALEFVGDGVFLVDGAGVIRLWNPAAERITGLSEAQAVGRPVAEVLVGWPLEGLGERAQTRPVELDGRELWLSFSAVEFLHRTVYAFRDLTEERAVEQLKTDFVSTVSHELRTPLAAIYGAAMTLQRADVALADEQRAGLLEVVAGESDRLARIVNDILWASRLDSGVLDVALESCDPGVLAGAVVAAARVHLPSGIELELTAPPDLPRVAADPDKARQVLVNLVDNAIKYSPDGGLVEVRLEDGGHVVRFSVSDRGLGIPPAEHARIFEKFFRLDPNLTRGVGGTGLGLYICRELVRRMDGRIWVDSAEAAGSTFAFELPVAST